MTMSNLKADLKTRFKLSAPLVHRLTAFWCWWIAELGGMLPKSIRAAALPGVERLYLQLNGTQVIASRGTGESIHEIARYPLTAEALPLEQAQEVAELAGRSRELILCLPADKVLLKTLSLPLVTESNLREVLGFEMDRQTPFSLEQVYYDHVLSKRNSKTNTLSLELVVTPRAYLDEQLSKLKSIGLQPDQVTLCRQKTGQTQPVNLLPEAARQRRPDSAQHLNLALAMLVLVLLLGTIALPLVNKIQVVQTLEARIELATSKAEVTRRLRDEVESLSTDSDFLVKKKQLTPLVLEIVNELTHILPDDTWINRLIIKGQEVQIQGQSAAAAALIPLIESSDSLHNPRFRSSVTRSQGSNSERFHLSAEVTGGAAK